VIYYNDNNAQACVWLHALMDSGLVERGKIDNRSISDVSGNQLLKYGRVHLFAGIAGWERALQIAGWPSDVPVWTGSCPCQPFSCAGKGKGDKDERHLWPEFRRLIDECRPPVVFGEQVASKLGRQWLSRVRLDLEEMGYAVGAADLCAAGVGAPHIRQRLYWMAYTGYRERRPFIEGRGTQGRTADGWFSPWSDSRIIHCRDGKTRRIPVESALFPLAHGIPGRVAALRGIGNSIVPVLAAEFVRAFMQVMEMF